MSNGMYNVNQDKEINYPYIMMCVPEGSNSQYESLPKCTTSGIFFTPTCWIQTFSNSPCRMVWSWISHNKNNIGIV